jgi:hypothetical protein
MHDWEEKLNAHGTLPTTHMVLQQRSRQFFPQQLEKDRLLLADLIQNINDRLRGINQTRLLLYAAYFNILLVPYARGAEVCFDLYCYRKYTDSTLRAEIAEVANALQVLINKVPVSTQLEENKSDLTRLRDNAVGLIARLENNLNILDNTRSILHLSNTIRVLENSLRNIRSDLLELQKNISRFNIPFMLFAHRTELRINVSDQVDAPLLKKG